VISKPYAAGPPQSNDPVRDAHRIRHEKRHVFSFVGKGKGAYSEPDNRRSGQQETRTTFMPPSSPLSEPSGSRAVRRCDALGVAPFSDSADGLFRAYLSPAHAATLDLVSDWMSEAGMTVRRDGMGNLIGRYEGLTADAPALLIGSHLDTVRDAGRYDGALGVLLGVETVAHFAARGQRFPFAIEVIGFGDEEGSRFPVSMLTSRAVAGTLETLPVELQDASGTTLAEALAAWSPDPPAHENTPLHNSRLRPENVRAYFEAHIEQGPVLESVDHRVGVVTAIAAQLRVQVSFTGVAGHAGTMPMSLRHDALAAASEAVLMIERTALDGPPDLVATVGQIAVAPGAANVVPGTAVFSLDIRAGTNGARDAAMTLIGAGLEQIGQARGVGLLIEPRHDLAATPCDPGLTRTLAACVRREIGDAPHHLVSGAGHDAMIMAALTPVCMLFIRSPGGVSHNPAETVRDGDVETAFRVMCGFVERLASPHGAIQEETSA
jgi:allantoate deiminase